MSGAACDVLDMDIGSAGADGDAVVAVGDDGVGDEDVLGVLDVDAVGVGAQRGGANGQAVDVHASAAVEPEVGLRAVVYLEPLHRHVVALEKPQCLEMGYLITVLLIRSSTRTTEAVG